MPYILQPHGTRDPLHRRRRRLVKDLCHWLMEERPLEVAATVLCTSEREQQAIRDLGCRMPTAIVSIGVDAQALRDPADPGELLERARTAPGDLIVTFLGRISAKKGLDLLVDEFRLTAEEFPKARPLVAYHDDEGIGRGLQPVIAAAGWSDRINFVGIVLGTENRALLQRSDIFLLLSADESFGIAVVEAMAVGCPVLVSANVAVHDLVRSAGAGIVTQRDPVDTGQAIATALSDRVAAEKMSQAGRRVVDEQFSGRDVAAQLETLYRSVAAGSA